MKKLSANKKVTLIIACRNERDIIADCLDSVLAQDYPASLMEIFAIDGESDDGTGEILARYSKEYPHLKVIENKKRIQPHAFNMGIKSSTGDYIFIMGAHNKYPRNYVSKCIRYALEYGADNVGGRIVAKTNQKGLLAEAIIGSYTSSFGIGNATFRKDTGKPTYVDTVFGGCYRRDVFDRIGFYNEELKRSQDMELNLRLVRAGGKILLAPDVVSDYYPKTTLLGFIRYGFRAGKGPIRAVRLTGQPLKLMHYVPAVFVLGLMLGPLLLLVESLNIVFYLYLFVVALYLLLAFIFGAVYSAKKKKLLLSLLLPLIFFLKHVSYGLGSLYAIFKLHD
jgi:cellulose synthase/poly-beta-1,6-N-acetylglucosamine synthase-like glycosyltransferase